jgi:hypothetical protein
VVEKTTNGCEIKKLNGGSNLILYRVDTTFEEYSTDIITDYLSDIEKRIAWDGAAFDKLK